MSLGKSQIEDRHVQLVNLSSHNTKWILSNLWQKCDWKAQWWRQLRKIGWKPHCMVHGFGVQFPLLVMCYCVIQPSPDSATAYPFTYMQWVSGAITLLLVCGASCFAYFFDTGSEELGVPVPTERLSCLSIVEFCIIYAPYSRWRNQSMRMYQNGLHFQRTLIK